jgi:hypothetical protein
MIRSLPNLRILLYLKGTVQCPARLENGVDALLGFD